MKTEKIAKSLGLLVLASLLVAGGYWWGRKHGRAVPAPTAGDSIPASDTQSHAGHDMGPAGDQISVSPQQQQLVGVRTALAEMRPLARKIRTVGIVTFDETRVAQVFSKVEGWIDRLSVDYTGKLVKKGQPLFTLYSPDLVATQEEYLLALSAKETMASSALPEIRSGASSLLNATRRRLSLWDISEQQIDELEQTRRPKTNLTIFSPISGFVIKKDALQGMRVMPDRELYTIADLSTVWVNADIYEFDLSQIHIGQKAAITLSYYPGRVFNGKVAWISPTMEEKTRTAKVRLEFANPDFTLKPEMYTNVEINIDAGRKLAVPDQAVLDSGLRKIVFLDKGDGRFAPAEVKLGGKYDTYYEVLAGLSPGERILASASFLLDSESRLHEAMGAMAGMPGMDMGDMQMPAPTAAGSEKKAGDLTLTLETQPAKPKLGDNVVRLRIRDNRGTPVTDAIVSLTSTMAMPGMAVGKAVAKHTKDGIYEAPVNLSMAGAWEIAVSVQRPGQKPVQEKFTVRTQ
jgi:Cu(I)/Ag(I) efflux system membrane fusion protein